jgi:fructose-1-phosphate kinase PfkB-like protein
VAVFAPAPVLVCTFEHPPDRSDPDVALNVGGQGPWVARAVTALGAEAILVVPLGGDTGRAAAHLLSDAPHEVRAVESKAATACYVEERQGGERSCVRDAPPGRFGQRELDELYSAALTAALDADVCVITGSPWTDRFDDGLLTRLTTDLATLGRTTVADLSGSQLDAALAGGVDWLKIAADELGDGAGRGSQLTEKAAWAAAERLSHAEGHRRNVIVSRAGSDPAVVMTTEARYRMASPELTTVDARGSGDAMTAALATGLAEQRQIEEVLRRAAAAGAANAVHKGSATPDRDLVDRLARTVALDRLDG